MPTVTKPKSKEDILKSFGITRATRYHDYDYLYESVLKAMDAFAQQHAAEMSVAELVGRVKEAVGVR